MNKMPDSRLKKLKQLLPEIFTNGEPDWDALKTIFSGEENQSAERYGFTWPGKKEAQQILQHT